MKKLLLALLFFLLLAPPGVQARAWVADGDDLVPVGISYLFRDEFSSDLATGSVNGSSAEPGPGVRTVTDAENKLSLSGGNLVVAGSKAVAAFGDPGIWWPAIARAAGRMLVVKLNSSSFGTSGVLTGWDTDTTGSVLGNGVQFAGGAMLNRDNVTTTVIGTAATSTNYVSFNILRASGAFQLISINGGYPLLYWVSTSLNGATLYPALGNHSATFTSPYIRIPVATWCPTPLLYDTFTRANGAVGSSETTSPDTGYNPPAVAWSGAGGSISSNALINTPTLGSELVVNGGFDNVDNWTVTPGVWSISGGVATKAAGSAGAAINAGLLVSGQWYKAQFTVSDFVADNIYAYESGASGAIFLPYSSGGNGTVSRTARSLIGGAAAIYANAAGAASIDNVSFKPLTLSTLFNSATLPTPDVLLTAKLTRIAGTQIGPLLNSDTNFASKLTANYDAGATALSLSALTKAVTTSDTVTIAGATYSISSVGALSGGVQGIVLYGGGLVAPVTASAEVPVRIGVNYASWNGIIAYMDGSGNLKVDKVVNGTYTNIASTAVTYVASAEMRAITDHVGGNLTVDMYYNNAKIGSTITISDATIKDNVIFGIFSTYEGNTTDDQYVYPRGTGGEFDYLNRFTTSCADDYLEDTYEMVA